MTSPISLLHRLPRVIATACALAAAALAIMATSASAAGTLIPTVDCAVNNGDGTYTAYFGYLNTGSTAVNQPIGDENEFTPGDPFQGQPTEFTVGSYPQVAAVRFDPTIVSTITWILNGSLVTATAGTPACQSGSTGPVSGVAQTSATLTGLIDPRGTSTTYDFEYGPTTAYGQSTPSQSSTSDDPFLASATLTGLAPATTYHYRVVSSSDFLGTTNGQDQTFTTPAPATTGALAVTTPASDLTPTSASLNGVVNPQGQATSYEFQWGTSTAYGNTTAPAGASGSDPQSASSALTGLTPGTTYHYRLIANQAGASTNGQDRTFTTPARSTSGQADLSIKVDRAPTSAIRGRSVSYTFTVTNGGPAAASAVVVTDLLAPGLRVQRIHASQGACTSYHGDACRLGDLAPGTHATIEIVVQARSTGALWQVVLAAGSQPDPDPANNLVNTLTKFSSPPRGAHYHRHLSQGL